MQEPSDVSDLDSRAEEFGAGGIFLRGVLMGLAELVPGVSGGTVAFISGIYYRLIGALAAFGPGSLAMLGDPVAFWHKHQLRFLLILGAGMGLGIVLFARLIAYAMEHAPPVLWAFFVGVIVVSVYQIGAARRLRNLASFGLLGLVLGLGFLSLPAQDFSGSMTALFVAGMIAVCAWILPGISGSFVLLLLGFYGEVIAAVNALDIPFLLVLMAGCASGLMLFSRALSWLLAKAEDPLLALLTGFMATALLKLWPWQGPATGAGNELGHLILSLRWPEQYGAEIGPDFFWLALLAGVTGGVGVWLLSTVRAK